MIGIHLSPHLEMISNQIQSFKEEYGLVKPEYTKEAFKAIVLIFADAIMDKMWELQEAEGMDLEDRIRMSETVGHEVRHLVKVFTNIDTMDFDKIETDQNQSNGKS